MDTGHDRDYNLYKLGAQYRSYAVILQGLKDIFLALEERGVFDGTADLDDYMYLFLGMDNIPQVKEHVQKFINEVYPEIKALCPDREARREVITAVSELVGDSIMKSLLMTLPSDVSGDPVFQMGFNNRNQHTKEV